MENNIALQNLDRNCNNCVFLFRDINKFKRSEAFHKEMQQTDFNKETIRLNNICNEFYKNQNFTAGLDLERKLKKRRFEFDKSFCSINYGTCEKFNKEVSFIPDTLQLDTQDCFKNRKNGEQ